MPKGTPTAIVTKVNAEVNKLLAMPEVRDAIMQTMPRRQAQSFEDTMRRTGPVPLSRIEQTRREIMAQVKTLVDAGEIEVQLFAEAVVE